MRWQRILTVTLVACAAAAVALQAAETPLQIHDEAAWYVRAQRPIWRTDEWNDYSWACDVPGECRLVYGAALDVFELDGLPCRQPEYGEKRWKANEENMCFAPADAVMALRGCNVAEFLLGLGALYIVALIVLRRPWLAALPLLAFLVTPTFPVEIVPRVGPDALLMGTLSAFLALWVWGEKQGWGRAWWFAVLVGFAGGVCAWAKVNGALALLAFAGWSAIRGRRGAALAAVALVMGAATFYVANPAFIGHFPGAVLEDIVARRTDVVTKFLSRQGPMAWTRVLAGAVGCWALLPVVAFAAWKARRLPHFGLVLWWGAALVVGNLAAINLPLPRYLGPVELGLYFTGGLAVCLAVSWKHVAEGDDDAR